MIKIRIKPLSVNEAWQGKRYKTDKYKAYEKCVLFSLPPLQIPKGPKTVYYTFGLSSVLSDLDNPVKLFQDILQKKYGFNDSEIYKAVIEKKIVSKGQEYLAFFFEPYL